MSRIVILCSDPDHPVMPHLRAWQEKMEGGHEVRIAQDVAEVGEGDFLFLVSCLAIVGREVRERFGHVLVLHASDLPRGRGWSPHIWSVLNGENRLCVSLIDAADPVDSGDIWQQREILLDGSELHDEINAALFAAELALMDWAVANCGSARPRAQQGEASHCPRRRPADSQVPVEATLAEIFDRLRVADPARFPAFFEHRGHRYKLMIEKMEPVPDSREADKDAP
jgi:methionyl-tRNA formyltransferase